jgi:hypothetical protein
MLLTRRHAAQILLGGAVATLLTACQTAPAPPPTPAVNPLIKPRAGKSDLTAVRANSELAMGRNRFAIGLLDAANQPVTDGSVLVEFFKTGKNNTNQKRGKAPAVFRSVGAPNKGIWAANTTFEESGSWNAQITQSPDGDAAPRITQLNFEVLDAFSAPGYDAPAPRSVTPTDRDVGGDLSRICTNSPPCALHTQSLDRAIADGSKPVIVTFATPALCTSALCAPELQAIQQLHSTYAEQANFVHVEIYQYPFDGTRFAPAVAEWRLPSDPWTFIVDKNGIVRDRFEGPAPADELESSLKSILA